MYPNVYVAHFVRNMIFFSDFQTLCSGSVNQLTICYFRNLSWEKILYKIYYSWLSILPAKYWKTWGKSAKFVWKKICFGEKCDFLLCKSFVDIYTSCLLASCLVSVIYECLPLLWMGKCIICIKKGPSCYFYCYCIKREANKMKISSHTRPVLSMALMHAHTH